MAKQCGAEAKLHRSLSRSRIVEILNLTFDVVDDLAHAAHKNVLSANALSGQIWQANEAGPAFELVQLIKSGRLDEWLLDHIRFGRLKRPLQNLLAKASAAPISLCGEVGSCRIGAEDFDGHNLTRFIQAARTAAVRAGIPESIAARFGAALGELESNVHEHSEAVDTGIALFAASAGKFEFCVADSGIGILASLQQNPLHQLMVGHDEALRTAIQHGGTRFGDRVMHGNGFDPIFEGLANYDGVLRFRSGDFAFEIDGRSPDVAVGTPKRKAMIPGFIACISCMLPELF